MKKIIFTVLIAAVAGITSCRKNDADPDVKQFDEEQIQAYIKNNAITGMQRDTSGIYYKVLTPGTGPSLSYADSIGLVFTLKTVDGNYSSADTISNHYSDYLGHLGTKGYPASLQSALLNLAKKYGTRIRLLVPSHIGYGLNGVGQGSSTNVNTRIEGNQCLDYYIHVINKLPGDNQNTYDEQVIKNYITANSLTGYQRTASGLYYKVLLPGVGSAQITDNTTITAFYTVSLLNAFVFNQYNTDPAASLDIPDLIKGVQEGLKIAGTSGVKLSFLIPSYLGYGKTGLTSLSVPGNSCLRFDVQVVNVTP